MPDYDGVTFYKGGALRKKRPVYQVFIQAVLILCFMFFVYWLAEIYR